MTKTIFRFVFVFAFVALFSACSNSKGGSCVNPAAPGCGGGNGGGDEPPDQTGLDPLGDAAPRHYLKDDAGKDTLVWVRLLEVSPARRSTVKGNAGCSFNCFTFSFSAEVGADAGFLGMAIVSFSLSDDCVNSQGRVNWQGDSESTNVVVAGTRGIAAGETYHHFDTHPIPKCLLVTGERSLTNPNGPRVVEHMAYPLVLDYQLPK